MIINPYLVLPSVSYDPDAQAFFNAESAAGVTLTTTQKDAVNQWVVDAKAAGIWTKMKAVYPMVGGTATAHKFNLINPADTDAAFRLNFIGGWIHSSNGALPNGTNAYASTFLIPNTVFGAGYAAIGIYINQALTVGGARPMGSTNMDILVNATFVRGANKASTNTTNTATLSMDGLIINSRVGATDTYIMNRSRTFVSSATAAVATYATTDIVLGATNTNGTIVSYSTGNIAFAFCSDSLSQAESLLFYQITEKYQVALGRNIYPAQSFYYNSAYNNETNAFLFSTQITDATIQTATNTLVNDLKAANIWTKMKAVYPMVGGTATTHKFNLVNAQDTDAAFRLVFSGGVTHSSSGIKGNNTNAWADTKLVPSTSLILNNFHYSFNTYTDALGTFAQGHISSQVSSTSIMQITSNNSNSILGYTGSTTASLNKTLASANHKGFWCGSRTANNDSYLLDPTGIFTSNTTAITYTNPSLSVGLMTVRISSPVNYSNFGYSFFSIGDGLTTSETTSLKTAVNNFQATLGRI